MNTKLSTPAKVRHRPNRLANPRQTERACLVRSSRSEGGIPVVQYLEDGQESGLELYVARFASYAQRGLAAAVRSVPDLKPGGAVKALDQPGSHPSRVWQVL